MSGASGAPVPASDLPPSAVQATTAANTASMRAGAPVPADDLPPEAAAAPSLNRAESAAVGTLGELGISPGAATDIVGGAEDAYTAASNTVAGVGNALDYFTRRSPAMSPGVSGGQPAGQTAAQAAQKPLLPYTSPGPAGQQLNQKWSPALKRAGQAAEALAGETFGPGAVQGAVGGAQKALANPDVQNAVNLLPVAGLGAGAAAAEGGEAAEAAEGGAAAPTTAAPTAPAAAPTSGPITPEELQQKGATGIGTSAAPAPKPRARVVNGKLTPAAAPPANPAPLFEPAADENARTASRTPEQRQQLASEAHDLGMNETRESALSGDRLEAATDYGVSRYSDAPAGRRMSGVIEGERAALRNVPAQMLAENGGVADTTENTAEAAGKDIAAPVTQYRQALEAKVKQAYTDVKEQHGDKPLQPTALNKFLTESDPEFTVSTEGQNLQKGIKSWLAKNDLLNPETDQVKPMNVYQAERLRQFVGDNFNPRTARLGYGLKDAIDEDVTRAAGENVYQQARAARSYIGAHFGEQPSISKLDEGDDRLGIARSVPFEDVGAHVEKMSAAEFRHYLGLMEDASKQSPALAQSVSNALTQVRAHFLRRILKEGDSTADMWNSKAVNAYLRNNEGKLSQIFRPQEIERLQKFNRVGNAMRMDRAYRGADASRVLGETFGIKALRKGGAAVATTVGAHAGGPVGALIGHGAGKLVEHYAEGRAEAAVEKRLVKLADEVKKTPPEQPRRLNVPRSQRGGPRMADFRKQPTPTHEVGGVGDHLFTLPGAELHAQETDVPGLGPSLKVTRSDTEEAQRGQGKGGALYRAAADYAHGRGMPLVSDVSVSPDAQRRWKGLQKEGYTVHMHRSAEPGVQGNLISGDIRRPVYISHPKLQGEPALAEKFAGQRGGPKASRAPALSSEYQASPELEKFVKSMAPAHRVDPNGPATWEELQKHQGAPVLPINPQSAEDSIYSSTPTNIAFRAWHDATHLRLGAGFDHEGELRVALEHQREAKAAGLSQADRAALWADTWETFKHHEQTGEFPSKPREFVANTMAKKFAPLAEKVAPAPQRAPLRQDYDPAAGLLDEQVRRDADRAHANPNAPRPPLRQGNDAAEALYAAQAREDAEQAAQAAPEAASQPAPRRFYPPRSQRGGPKFTPQRQAGVEAGGGAPAKTLSFRHFSNAEGAPERLTLSPEYSGAGLPGAERRRMANNGAPKVISAYAEKHPDDQVEPELRGKPEYRVTVPESSVYNLSKDPAKIRVAAKALADEEGIDEHTAAERLLQSHGYAGYHLPGAQGVLKGQARFFKPVEGVRADIAERDRLAAAVPGSEHLTPDEREGVKRLQEKKLTDAFAEVPHSRELAAAALAGEAKRGWYRQAAHAISTVFGGDAPRFTALLAAMSPQTSVEMNFHNALRSFVAWDDAGRPQDAKSIVKIMEKNSLRNPKSTSQSNVLGAWRNNAIRALTAKDPEAIQLSGPKVDSFMKNLRNNVHAVTLDSWMAKFAGLKQDLLSGIGRKVSEDELRGSLKGKNATYKAYSARVREAAELLTRMTHHAWTPEEVQETVWSWSKAASEHADETGTPIPKLLKQGDIHDDLIRGTSDFHSLFQQPGHADTLRRSNFAGGLEKLQGSEVPAGPRTPEEARAAAQARLAPHLKRAAARLEEVREPVPF